MQFMVEDYTIEPASASKGNYGSVYLLVAIGLFVVFSVFHGGFLNAVSTIADDFTNKLDKMSIASERNLNL